MREIRRPDDAEPTVERLTKPEKGSAAAVFPTIIDLLIFAAGVGLQMKKSIPVSANGRGLPLRLWESAQKDGYLYMVALAAKSNAEIIGGEKDDEVAQIFEEFAAGGLEEISRWLALNPTDVSGVESIIAKMQSHIALATPTVANPNPL